MKSKILIIGFVMMLATFVFGLNVYAKESITSANITLTSSKTDYNPGDVAEFTIHLSNLNATKGILAFGGVINYNSSVLELTQVDGLNGWSSNGNETNVIAIIRSSNSGNEEDIAKIKFKVLKPDQTTTFSIKLTNVELANGGGYKINEVTSNQVTVKVQEESEPTPSQSTQPTQSSNPTQGPSQEPTPSKDPTKPSQTPDKGDGNDGNGDNNGNPSDGNNGNNQSNNNSNNNNNNNSNKGSNSNSNSNKSDGSTSNQKLPALGAKGVTAILISVVAIVAVALFVRMKLLDKKIKKTAAKKIEKHDENN